MKLHEPATDAQKKFASELGLTFDEDITQGDIHLLINTVAPHKDRPPTRGQIEFATNIGAVFDPAKVTGRYLKALIEYTIDQRSRAILQNNPHLKVDAVIEYQGASYRISSIGAIMQEPWRMRLSPVGGGRARVIYVIDLETSHHK